jgi:hypothetical protein
MTDELDPSTALANLEAENDERLRRIVAERVALPAGMFENIRLTAYLEVLLSKAGTHVLDDAKMEFANRVSGVLDNIEEQVRKAKIGIGNLTPQDMDKIIQLGRRDAN